MTQAFRAEPPSNSYPNGKYVTLFPEDIDENALTEALNASPKPSVPILLLYKRGILQGKPVVVSTQDLADLRSREDTNPIIKATAEPKPTKLVFCAIEYASQRVAVACRVMQGLRV